MKELIFEELSISTEVVNTSDILVKEILTNIIKTEWEYSDNYKRYVKNTFFMFEQPNFNSLVLVYFLNMKNLEDYQENINLFGGISNRHDKYDICNLNFTLPSIDGKVYSEYIVPTIQHELEHVFQINKSNTPLLTEFYKIALELTNNSDQKYNDIESTLGYIFYFLSRQEVNANTNSLYAELKQKKIQNMDDVDKTEIVKEYKYIKELIIKFVNNENLETVSKYFNWSVNKLQKFIIEQERYLQTKFGKAIQNYFNQIKKNNV